MKIVNIKNKFHDERVLSVISYSLFNPTSESLKRRADAYESDTAVDAFAYMEHGLTLGVIIVRRSGNREFEILSIAVDPQYRKQGIASALILHTLSTLKCATLIAETDDDAVAFYRNYGFQIQSLGEKHPGIVRYRCVLKLE